MKNKAKKPMELYVHIPFCVKKCDYCDFLSGPAGKERQREYFQSLGREIAAVPEFPDREITTVFIGGGTPSVPDPALMGAILDQIRNKFFMAPDAEITIEANPGTLYKEKLQEYRKHGVNRLSLGLQSPQNRELKILGRIHTWEEFLESFFMAETKKGEGLVYKNHPLRRVDNLIYYGTMAEKYIIMMQILDSADMKDLPVAKRVSVQLQQTGANVRNKDRIVKKTEKNSLWSAMDIASIWLDRALGSR